MLFVIYWSRLERRARAKRETRSLWITRLAYLVGSSIIEKKYGGEVPKFLWLKPNFGYFVYPQQDCFIRECAALVVTREGVYDGLSSSGVWRQKL